MNVQVWDIGADIVSDMLGLYVFGPDVVFLCYDVTDANSFEDLETGLGLLNDLYGRENRSLRVWDTRCAQQARPAGVCGWQQGGFTAPAARDRGRARKFYTRARPEGGFFVSARSGEDVLSLCGLLVTAWV